MLGENALGYVTGIIVSRLGFELVTILLNLDKHLMLICWDVWYCGLPNAVYHVAYRHANARLCQSQ